ncbi:hypothetical protein BBJ28_00017712 [Nothophytophthora sp. Chile5]|nr:hypothetical protein BBJ28_00017712 [Nothophytophthora sp. Chile5]
MTKRPLASETATCFKHSRPALNSARSPPLRSEDEGLDFPADTIDFCHFLQFDNEGEDGELLADGVLPDHDLVRNRRVGCELEADVARMQQQRQDELVHSSRERQELRMREQAVQVRELASTRSKEDVARLQERLDSDVHQHQQGEVRALLSDVVERVDLASRKSHVQSMQEELTWSQWLQQDALESAADLTKQWRETEVVVDVEQELQRVHMMRLDTQLGVIQERRLQAEVERGEMEAKWTTLQQEAASLSSWVNVAAFCDVELAERLRISGDGGGDDEKPLQIPDNEHTACCRSSRGCSSRGAQNGNGAHAADGAGSCSSLSVSLAAVPEDDEEEASQL